MTRSVAFAAIIFFTLQAQPISSSARPVGTIVVPTFQLDDDLDPIPGNRPKITRVSRILAEQTQTIIITGRNLGTSQPFNGDSNYLKVVDDPKNAGAWAAGCGPADGGPCGTTLNVTSWTDTQIVIAGFTGTYGSNPLRRNGVAVFEVWNPQTGAGPTAIAKVVK
jgi:hypothetical protein